jgi:hypothetical protein
MKKFIICPILIIIFIVYYLTMAKTILPNGDSGEMVSTAFFGGIAHPPGYPLYNLVGHLFLKLPIFGEPAFRLNLLSIFFHIGALLFVYKTCLLLSTKNYILSAFCVLTLAFSYSFWLYSFVAEVFALHDLLFSILLYILIIIARSRNHNFIRKYALIWSFIFGLGMSNNHLIIILLPAFVYLLYKKNLDFQIYRGVFAKIRICFVMIATFIIGLLPYLYFFWARNNVNPVTWSYPNDLNDFIRFFLRLNYGDFLNYHDFGFVALEMKTVLLNFALHLTSFFGDFWIIVAFFPFLILFFVYKRKHLISKLFLILFLSQLFLDIVMKFGLWSFVFSILERLFLSFNILFSISLSLFLVFIFQQIKVKKYRFYGYLILLFLVFFLFLINAKRANQSKNYICRDVYDDIISLVPKNSLVFISGDIQQFCFEYYHYVLDLGRNDNNIYVFANAFLLNNRGRYLADRYGLKLNKDVNNGDDLANLFKNRKNIVSIGRDLPSVYRGVKIGISDIAVNPKHRYGYQEIYEMNYNWFLKSRLMNRYDDFSYMNLANRGLKEIYCGDYLNLVLTFHLAKQDKLAMKTMNNMKFFCEFSDFTSTDSSNLFLNLQSKLLSVKD